MAKMTKRNLLLSSLMTVGAILAFSNNVQAAPLNNVEVQLKQPNGEILKCYTSGDEFYNYYHDEQNQLIIKNPRTGYYSYAKYSADKVQPSQDKVEKEKSVGKVKETYINVPQQEIDKKRKEMEIGQNEIQNVNDNGNKRTLNNINVYIKFSDQVGFDKSSDFYEKMFNDTNGLSLRNYYKEASYNKLDVVTHSFPKTNDKTVLCYTDPNPRSYYAKYPEAERAAREHTLIKNAIEYVKKQIPQNLDVDSDNDGKVDNICFIIPGQPEGWNSLLWPHKWSLFSYDVNINNKKVNTYNFQFEGHLTGAGQGASVLAHEMFHSLGAPDLYKYVSRDVPVGQWDVMASHQSPPQHMSAYMKQKYGKWENIAEINKSGTYSINDITSPNNNAYIIKSNKSDSEYFEIEYRGANGYDKSLSKYAGLIVSRINPKVNGNQNADNEIYVLRENNNVNYVNNANLNPKGSIRAIGKGTNILMTFTNGVDSEIKIDNVKLENGKATFDVTYPGDGKKVVENKEKTAKEIADSINSVEQPKDNDKQIKIPVVPQGYGIKVSYSSVPNVIDLNGNITRQKYANNISVKFEVTRLSDQTKAETKVFNIAIKEKIDEVKEAAQVSLVDKSMERCNAVAGGVWINKTPYNNKIQLGQVKYEKGISFYSTADVSYNLSGKYSRFTADIGINDEVGQYGSVEAQVYGDGRLLYSSGLITGKDYVKKLNIDITNVNKLQLVITNGGDGQAYDSVSFANPTLYTK